MFVILVCNIVCDITFLRKWCVIAFPTKVMFCACLMTSHSSETFTITVSDGGLSTTEWCRHLRLVVSANCEFHHEIASHISIAWMNWCMTWRIQNWPPYCRPWGLPCFKDWELPNTMTLPRGYGDKGSCLAGVYDSQIAEKQHKTWLRSRKPTSLLKGTKT